MVAANENDPPKTTTPCPTCGKPSHPDYRPFCSKRCADVDLQRWLSGRYAIPVVEEDKGTGEDSGDRD
jgi:endogenous inhibitor of DNA gyrase (YacG/DUF329 family)